MNKPSWVFGWMMAVIGAATGRLRPGALLACAALIGAGCATFQPKEDPTRYYVLTSPTKQPVRSGSSAGNPGLTVGVRPIEIPAYLASKSIVIRTGPNELTFSDLHRWAEPLNLGLARVVREGMLARGGVSQVVLDARAGQGLDFVISLRVLACEGVRDRAATGNASIGFVVAWEVRETRSGSAGGRPVEGIFTAAPVRWDGADYGELAQHLSQAAANLVEGLVSHVAPAVSTQPERN